MLPWLQVTLYSRPSQGSHPTHLLFHKQVRRGTCLWQTLLPIEHWWPAKLPAERREGGCLVLCLCLSWLLGLLSNTLLFHPSLAMTALKANPCQGKTGVKDAQSSSSSYSCCPPPTQCVKLSTGSGQIQWTKTGQHKSSLSSSLSFTS